MSVCLKIVFKLKKHKTEKNDIFIHLLFICKKTIIINYLNMTKTYYGDIHYDFIKRKKTCTKTSYDCNNLYLNTFTNRKLLNTFIFKTPHISNIIFITKNTECRLPPSVDIYKNFIKNFSNIEHKSVNDNDIIKETRTYRTSTSHNGKDKITEHDAFVTEIRSEEYEYQHCDKCCTECLCDVFRHQTRQIIVNFYDNKETNEFKVRVKVIFATYGINDDNNIYKYFEVFSSDMYDVSEKDLKQFSQLEIIKTHAYLTNNKFILDIAKTNYIYLVSIWMNNQNNHNYSPFKLGTCSNVTYLMKVDDVEYKLKMKLSSVEKKYIGQK